MAFRLNEKPLIQKVYESIPTSDIKLIVKQLPTSYLSNALRYIGERMDRSPHLEFDLLWVNALLSLHGRYLREHSLEYASYFRAVNKSLTELQQSVTSLCEENTGKLSYLVDQAQAETNRNTLITAP